MQLAEQTTDLYLANQLSPEPPAAAVAKVDPRPFAGWYRDADSHSVLQVIASGNEVEIFGQHFKPLDASHFAGPDESDAVFSRQQNGATRLTLTFKDTAPQIFETYEPLKASQESFSQYAGEYTSTEVEATYRLYAKEGKLTLAANWQEPFVLEPTVRDEFQGPYGSALVFRRDSNGRIFGFEAFAGRVRNIAFVKTSK
ncbi:MAG TPA: hypothetical protein VE077_12275 [Candidatus Methylomirabilis sp.]|nr:hypothetical protein [Candidatus Methylomirabilis sp.]